MMLANPTEVAQWAFDTHAHQINAVDQQGRVLMAIAASPLFGQRLAAAFCWPAAIALLPIRSGSEDPR